MGASTVKNQLANYQSIRSYNCFKLENSKFCKLGFSSTSVWHDVVELQGKKNFGNALAFEMFSVPKFTASDAIGCIDM